LSPSYCVDRIPFLDQKSYPKGLELFARNNLASSDLLEITFMSFASASSSHFYKTQSYLFYTEFYRKQKIPYNMWYFCVISEDDSSKAIDSVIEPIPFPERDFIISNIVKDRRNYLRELKQKASQKGFEYFKDLTMDGDVEKNPGPRCSRCHVNWPTSFFRFQFRRRRVCTICSVFKPKVRDRLGPSIRRSKEWTKDCSQDGDVEKNPGPICFICMSSNNFSRCQHLFTDSEECYRCSVCHQYHSRFLFSLSQLKRREEARCKFCMRRKKKDYESGSNKEFKREGSNRKPKLNPNNS